MPRHPPDVDRAGAPVRLDLDPDGDDTDTYGHILRHVVLASGENVNATLIREGCATAIRTFPYSRHREFLQLEAQARTARLGDGPIRKGDRQHAPATT